MPRDPRSTVDARGVQAAEDADGSGGRIPDALEDAVQNSLAGEVAPAVARCGAELAARPGVVAVLFYGNRLRAPQDGGLIDLYALTGSDHAFHGPGVGALANRVLPPTVLHLPAEADRPGAKVAVMTLAAFAARMRRESRDTTLWARFVQPARLLHARDAEVRAEVLRAIAEGWRTAAWWADRLAEDTPRWRALFAATYEAELRVEATDRAGAVVAAAPGHYAMLDRLLPPALPGPEARAEARRLWPRRVRAGRALNALRLVKAAATFRGGPAYARAKILRHAGTETLTPLARRAPWRAAALVLWRRLRRRGPH